MSANAFFKKGSIPIVALDFFAVHGTKHESNCNGPVALPQIQMMHLTQVDLELRQRIGDLAGRNRVPLSVSQLVVAGGGGGAVQGGRVGHVHPPGLVVYHVWNERNSGFVCVPALYYMNQSDVLC